MGQPVQRVSGESIWTLARQSDLPNEPLLPIATPPCSCKVQGTVNRPSAARLRCYVLLDLKPKVFSQDWSRNPWLGLKLATDAAVDGSSDF